MPMDFMLVRGEFASGYFSKIRRLTRTVSARGGIPQPSLDSLMSFSVGLFVGCRALGWANAAVALYMTRAGVLRGWIAPRSRRRVRRTRQQQPVSLASLPLYSHCGRYRPHSTTWHSVRTAACLGASALVMFALAWPI